MERYRCTSAITAKSNHLTHDFGTIAGARSGYSCGEEHVFATCLRY